MDEVIGNYILQDRRVYYYILGIIPVHITTLKSRKRRDLEIKTFHKIAKHKI